MCIEFRERSVMSNEPKIKNAILVNEFSEYGVKLFKTDFDELNSSPMPIIPIFIDSFGGEIYSLLAMLDIMSTSVKPIATIALGKAMSCGSILLACGSPKFRFVGPHSTVMIHDAATFSFGKIEDLKADVGEAERLNHKIFEILNEKCSKSKGYFQSQVAAKKHVNWYLDSSEVLKHGLADHVGIPVIDSLFNLDIVSLPKKTKSTKPTNKKKSSKKK
ncbi:ClpP Protease subunit of ATP-dependent Clp proteases [uncultured Caudovirales phage]|uniref:ClpP Protease subunit of ATP-dependent Clp proteases n=1 Tax=uncultured Caudovirales phage TaxID=2100421 RepID=A0A6J5M4Y0_9CAUD|nr:ClpP Protease subunit of ATP-dependent Clp proteases [uncultured Caudovirales phage]